MIRFICFFALLGFSSISLQLKAMEVLKEEKNKVAKQVKSAKPEKADQETQQEKQLVNEETNSQVITVLSSKAPQHFTDLSTTNSYVTPKDTVGAANQLLDLITEIPGVTENGQSGLFQTYSIRGVSRQRVLTYLSDIPIKAERRAGVAASFLHPLLLDSVEVKKGPASTLYQSGSLGGVIKMQPRFFNETSWTTDYHSAGNSQQHIFGTSGQDWSLGFAGQFASNSQDVNGAELNDGYNQYSASFIKQWHSEDLDYELMLLASRGTDIGRSSTRFPDRVVSVPQEEHLLGQFAIQSDNWRASIYLHPNQTETLTLRPANRTNEVQNKSNDWGFHFEQRWNTELFEGLYGLDTFVRNNIDASDKSISLTDSSVTLTESLSGASERESAAFFTLNKAFDSSKWQLGLRLINNEQNNQSNTIVNNSLTGFVGKSFALSDNILLTTSLGTGIRFPTVSERFFVGTTARGEVEGNPNLKEERSISADLGLKYSDASISFAANLYQQRVSDYIERVEIAPELLSFRNIQDGTIKGIELDAVYSLNKDLKLSFFTSFIEGEDQAGNPLADIPSHRSKLKLDYQAEKYLLKFGIEYRQDKNSIGAGEKPIANALLADVSFAYLFNDKFRIQFSLDNLLDEDYFSSADELAPLANGREWGISLTKQW